MLTTQRKKKKRLTGVVLTWRRRLTDLLYARVGQEPVSSAYVTTLTFNGSCPSNVTSQRDLMTSLSVELNRRAMCVSSRRLTDVCDVMNYVVCPGVSSQHRRTDRQSPPLTVSIVLYAPSTYVSPPLSLSSLHVDEQ